MTLKVDSLELHSLLFIRDKEMVNDFLIFLIFWLALANPMMGKMQLGDKKQRAAMLKMKESVKSPVGNKTFTCVGESHIANKNQVKSPTTGCIQ